MLKILFGCLLLINAILFGAHFGWMDTVLSGSHEPQRLKNQINADKLRLVAPEAAAASAAAPSPAAVPGSPAAPAVTPPASPSTSAPAAPASPAPGPAPASSDASSAAPVSVAAVSGANPSPGNALACVEIGNLSAAEGKRMELALASLKLPQAPLRRQAHEQSTHMVWIAPLPTGREGAQRKLAELKRLGINDFHVLGDTSLPEQRNGVSLGVFKTEEAAKARLAALAEKGVKSARIVEYRMPLTRVSFQLRQLDKAGKEALGKLRADFPRSEEKPCDASGA